MSFLLSFLLFAWDVAILMLHLFYCVFVDVTLLTGFVCGRYCSRTKIYDTTEVTQNLS